VKQLLLLLHISAGSNMAAPGLPLPSSFVIKSRKVLLVDCQHDGIGLHPKTPIDEFPLKRSDAARTPDHYCISRR
jgi:hypothetical protein